MLWRFLQAQSSAPDLMRLSTARLFVSLPYIRSQKSEKSRKGSVLLPLGDELADAAPADVLDREQAETDRVPAHREALAADVDVGGQHLDAHAAALADILDDLVGVVEHAREKRSHKLAWVMAFQPCRLVRYERVRRRMGFVEGIGGERAHLVEDLVRGLPRHAVGLCALYEDLPLLLHHIVLLLGHRAAHEVGAPVGVAAERAADLHDLLLVDDAPVSHVENRR